MRLLVIFVLLGLLFALPLLVFGDRFDQGLAGPQGLAWLRDYGAWSWLAGIGLLIADLVLPIPSTVVMAAMGLLYGPIIGGMVSTAGTLLAGLLAYGAARVLGRPAAVFIAGERDLARAERFFARGGGWAVAMARPAPLLAEVVACLAGLAGMRFGRFLAALTCGSLPMGFAFATIGHLGVTHPWPAIAISALAPLSLWPVAQRMLIRRDRVELPPDHGAPVQPVDQRDGDPRNAGSRPAQRNSANSR